MKKLKLITATIFTIILSACSSNDYASQHAEKKPLTNDRELLISLLKRPTTADQIMMERFALSQQSHSQAGVFNAPQVGYVMIKGNRSESSPTRNTSNDWIFEQSNAIYNTSFVRLSGPN